ncbi:MAG: ribulose-phosphate 3-epimerase [Ruminococcaceae bacterium]|nr:ribulose-phosphate 3-epimerase [Oscillospiraceae bacterium]
MIKFSPSILAANIAHLEQDIKSVEFAGASYLHFDVMDGHFVPNLSFGLPVLESVRKITAMPMDVHLMISQPDRYIDRFVKAGADMLTIHLEAEGDTLSQIRRIRELGSKPAVSIKPATPIDELIPLLPELNMVLIMTVEPGFGGQKFMMETVPKIRELRRIINENGYSCDIEVDGGVTESNIADIVGYGANVIVAGSSIFGTDDPGEALKYMRWKTEV